MKIPTYRGVLFALSCSLLIAGCGGSEKDKPASQVAAKVNKAEISVHQINGALARSGNIPPEQAKVASHEVLEKLIDQELLVEKAVDKKLDRDPRVMQTMEANRQQILAQAYMQQVIAAVSKPTADEINTYFSQHPELFAERRLYRFQEVTAAVPREQLPDLQKDIAAAKTLDDVLAGFKAKNIPFNSTPSVKAAEQVPLDLLPRISQMKNGQIIVVPAENRVVLMQLTESRAAPVTVAAATPLIELFLSNQRRNEVAAKEVKQLRAEAKIEYVGEFTKSKETLAAEARAEAAQKARAQAVLDAKARSDTDARTKAAADADADARARADLRAKVDAQAQADKAGVKGATAEAALPKDAISKGLSGLR